MAKSNKKEPKKVPKIKFGGIAKFNTKTNKIEFLKDFEVPKELKGVVDKLKEGLGEDCGDPTCPIHGRKAKFGKPLEKERQEIALSLIKDIGSNKKKGFVFVVEAREDKTGGMDVEGVQYVNNVPVTAVLLTICKSLGVTNKELFNLIMNR